MEEMRQEYIKLRDHVVKGLRSISGVKCTMPEGAFYAYPNVSEFFGRSGINSASGDLAGKLLREVHVATVPGEGFGTRRNTFAFRTPRRLLNLTVGWSGCESSLADCKSIAPQFRDI